MLLYSHTLSPRLKYISGFISKELFPEPLQLTSDRSEFQNYKGNKINYHSEPVSENEYRIFPSGLLFENEIREQDLQFALIGDLKIIFPTKADLPFDIFSACFYLISRYEEYLPHQKDEYGRFAHTNSVAFKNGFLNQPLVNRWLEILKTSLNEKFPGIKFKENSFRFQPTYDIDEAWAYLHKSSLRNAAGFGKALLSGKWKNAFERVKVRSGRKPDPYDSYEWLNAIHKEFNLKPKYFFLVAKRKGDYDKNISSDDKSFQSLIKSHAEKYEIGIHPSWQSGDKPELLKEEMDTLKKITGKEIIFSRQHYIRFNLPKTYRQLINAGITQDYSMGYGSINGFRASVASSFNWYDLEKEIETQLEIFPFCFMEANSFFEQKLNPRDALEEIISYYNKVRSVNGLMISIWHNTFLGTEKRFEGWKNIYKEFLRNL